MSVLLAASLAGKLLSRPVDGTAGRDAVETAITERLLVRGFAADGMAVLSVDGFYRALAFSHATCGALRAIAVPLNGEASEIVRQLPEPGEIVAYLYDGRMLAEAPVSRAVMRENAIRIAYAVGWTPDNGQVSIPALVGSERCVAIAAAAAGDR